MAITTDDRRALEELDYRLRILLPEEYHDRHGDVQPVSMGSAGLKYASDGRVAWDEIWGSFCDLAMAGGPPHKGRLLEPGVRAEIHAHPHRHREVVNEICRGVTLVTDLPADISPRPGWVRVECHSGIMAGWLLRAITMENVAVRAEGLALDLPASPDFRLEKEIKNVVTVAAKTCHYWLGHMPRAQRQAIGTLLTTLAVASPLIAPEWPAEDETAAEVPTVAAMAARIHRETGLSASAQHYTGWLGIDCPSVRTAVWMMRGLVVSNVLARREETVLFVPVNPTHDPGGERVADVLTRTHQLAAADGVL